MPDNLNSTTIIRSPNHGRFGKLAQEWSKVNLPISICNSAAGYYIGTCDESGPVSRESFEYWPTKLQAESAFKSGEWNQRLTP